MSFAAIEDDGVSYPTSDGEPMAEGDTQGDAIRTLVAGFRHLYRDEPTVHVSGDMLWYPVRGNPRVCVAPDVMVIDECPRQPNLGAYLPWEHGGRSPRITVEVLSPTNTVVQMLDKLSFYTRHGVDEYLFVDPFTPTLRAWLRSGDALVPQLVTDRWVSPSSAVSFGFDVDELVVLGPDGRRWLVPEDEIARADAERTRADAERTRANAERTRADVAEAELARLRAELGLHRP